MSKADFVIKGKILSPDFGTSFYGSVAVGGSRILAAGTDIQSFISADTKIYDYGDSFIMPGFHDAHVHIIQGTLTDEGADLRDACSEEEAAKMTADSAEHQAMPPWVLGGAWDHFKWPGRRLPSKESLDKYFPDRPVFLLNKECHGAWANSKTLAYFNITKDTPNPEHGEIFRDGNGEPTGYLHEDAALDIISQIYDISDFAHLSLTEKFMSRTGKLGITSVSDLQIYGIMKYHAFAELERQQRLTVRVHFCPPITDEIKKLKYLQKVFDSEKLRFSGAKGFVDGTPMGYTGLMVEPYSDRPGFYGETVLEPMALKELVTKLDEANIRCRLHACGDGAVRLGLDAFEEARKANGIKDSRHTIEHIECIHPDDIRRFAELDVMASVQPEHMPKYDFDNHPFHPILGPERIKYAWPFGSIEKAGGILSFGTDYPIAPLDPFRGIYRAVTRLTNDGEPKGGFNPGEKLSRSSALRAYTLGSAYTNGREKDLGTLEAGKLADIIVLTKDLLNCEEDEIRDTEVLTTIMDGEVIFEK